MAQAKEVMNIKEASQYLGISPDSLYKYVSLERIPAFKLGNRWRFKKTILDEWMAQRTTEEVMQRLLKYGVPVGPSQTAKELVACPQLKARKMILEIEDPVGGKKKVVGSPVKLSAVSDLEPQRPPALGEHVEEVLGKLLGFTKEKIDALRAGKVV